MIWLVVEPYPSERCELVILDDYSQLNGTKNMFQSPPTSYDVFFNLMLFDVFFLDILATSLVSKTSTFHVDSTVDLDGASR